MNNRVALACMAMLAYSPLSADDTVKVGPLGLEQVSPASVTYVEGVDFAWVGDSFPGDVTALVTAVDVSLGLGNSSTSGCEVADFAGFPVGHIALIQRGACAFSLKSSNAADAGASAVILFNQGNTPSRNGVIDTFLGDAFSGGIPVYFATYSRGEEWANTAGLEMRVDASNLFRGSSGEAYLEYCKANSDGCTLSVRHVSQGWERHLNPDRPQVTASTYKILTLIAYGEAVVAGEIDPNEIISRDDWARFSVRRDGGALSNMFDRLGSPADVTVDEMVRGMMRESDNATPDWLLNRLGENALEKVVRRYVEGYHDVPTSINSVFLKMDANPDEAFVATRILEDYSGFDAYGFKTEVLEQFFGPMQDSNFIQDARDLTCVSVPWKSPPPSCSPGWENTTAQWRSLLGNFFTQASSRTYMRLMEGLLLGDLVNQDVAAVIQPHLEFRLEFSDLSDRFARYGAKGGSFGPQDVCNWTAYLQDADSGDQVVVSTFTKDGKFSCGTEGQPWAFAQEFAEDPVFAEHVMNSIPSTQALPELLARVTRMQWTPAKGDKRFQGKLQVQNISPTPASSPFAVQLVVSSDRNVDDSDEVVGSWLLSGLEEGKPRSFPFHRKGSNSVSGQYLLLQVDVYDAVTESVESNNLVIDRLQ